MSNIHPLRPKRETEQTAASPPANENSSGAPSLVPTSPVYSDWLQKGAEPAPKRSAVSVASDTGRTFSYVGYAILAIAVLAFAYILSGPMLELTGPVTVTGQD